jgi:hypothetical protein
MHMHDVACRGQHGDGCHDSQGTRAPPALVTAGLAVHRDLLKKPKQDIVSPAVTGVGRISR